jgi:hypothetical protein
VSTIAEIQDAIQKLPLQEQRQLSTWLFAQENKRSVSFTENALRDMAADPQVRAELRRINQEFASVEADGLGKI